MSFTFHRVYRREIMKFKAKENAKDSQAVKSGKALTVYFIVYL